MNINLVKLYVTTFIIFAIESEKKRRSVLEQRGRKDSERWSGSMRREKHLRCNSAYASMKFKTYSGLAFTNMCKKDKMVSDY